MTQRDREENMGSSGTVDWAVYDALVTKMVKAKDRIHKLEAALQWEIEHSTDAATVHNCKQALKGKP